MVNKVYGLLGICSKAGKLISGTDIVLEHLAKKKVSLVIVAEDASEKTIKILNIIVRKKMLNYLYMVI